MGTPARTGRGCVLTHPAMKHTTTTITTVTFRVSMLFAERITGDKIERIAAGVNSGKNKNPGFRIFEWCE